MEIYLYDEGTCRSLRIDEVAADLRQLTGFEVEPRPEFLSHWVARAHHDPGELSRAGQRLVHGYPDAVAAVLAGARVSDPMNRLQPARVPMRAELSAESRALQATGRTSTGILYDGAVLQWALWEVIQPDEQDACHIVVTGRLFGTWMAEDRRWHAHSSLYGEPSIISTSGLVQAPARPREYYAGQQLAAARMVPRELVEARLQQELGSRMLVLDDPRMTQAVTGYALQAAASHLTGSPFCSIPTCRLYNARRQEELIRAQCGPESGLCAAHTRLFGSHGGAAGD